MSARKHKMERELGDAADTAMEKGTELAEEAKRRVTRAYRGNRPEDVVIKSVLGAIVAGVAVRLIRETPIGSIVARLAPMAAFALLYEQYSSSAASTRSR